MQLPHATVLCNYHYNALDQLAGHALPAFPERQRFYCKSRLVTEIHGAMRYSIFQHDDQLLAQRQGENGSAADTSLLATDQQCSVLETLTLNHPRKPVAYSPYGHRAILNGLLSLLAFNGEQPDPVTGCYLLGNGYRAFNPVLMRFNCPDGLSPFGKGGLNAYVYCSGDPINSKDPTGRYGERILAFLSKRYGEDISYFRNTLNRAGAQIERSGLYKYSDGSTADMDQMLQEKAFGLMLEDMDSVIKPFIKDPLLASGPSGQAHLRVAIDYASQINDNVARFSVFPDRLGAEGVRVLWEMSQERLFTVQTLVNAPAIAPARAGTNFGSAAPRRESPPPSYGATFPNPTADLSQTSRNIRKP